MAMETWLNEVYIRDVVLSDRVADLQDAVPIGFQQQLACRFLYNRNRSTHFSIELLPELLFHCGNKCPLPPPRNLIFAIPESGRCLKLNCELLKPHTHQHVNVSLDMRFQKCTSQKAQFKFCGSVELNPKVSRSDPFLSGNKQLFFSNVTLISHQTYPGACRMIR